MPFSFVGWSVKAKVQNRRARVADAAHKELPAGGVRYPRPSDVRRQKSEVSNQRRDRNSHPPAARNRGAGRNKHGTTVGDNDGSATPATVFRRRG